ncbi:MAG: hypothetical protein ABIZ09_17180 [Rhodoferax sp.]
MSFFSLKSTACFLGLLAVMGCANATPVLTCRVTYADETHVIEVKPTDDIYNVVPIDIAGRFTFKAVMVAKRDTIDYVKLYVYFQQRRKDIPIHLASYFPPFALSAKPSVLTPLNYLYAGDAERGLQYQCSLRKVTP